LIVTEEQGLVLDGGSWLNSCTFDVSIKYINGDNALHDIRWSMVDRLAAKGFILLNVGLDDYTVKAIYCNVVHEIAKLNYGETLLVGEIIEPIRLIGVQPHHAEAYRKLGR
jgi:hypothetical protein